MNTPKSFHRQLLAAVLAMATLGMATPASAEYNPKQLRIGFQKSASILSLIRSQGTLEKLLAPKGIEVKWVEFPAGPQLLEGLNVGAIDIGNVGEAPPIFAQAAGANFIYVGTEIPSPQAEAILVPKNSAIKTVADLKGKKVVLNKGSNVHYLLVKALEKAGLKYSDITPVFLPPADARAAFEKGSIDAWVIWEPFLSAAEKQANARILADGTGIVSNYNFFLAEREFAEKRADVIKLIFEESQKHALIIKKDVKAAAAIIAPLQGLDPAIVEQALTRYELQTVAIDDKILDNQQKVADTFFELKLIPKAIKVRDAALKR
ncbi:sulfonate ABC transporter substrate-binding protein [Uliginosibacterium sp. 31-16]|uniref:sulfonate ABC transporter substrate-binding protein n=1 Tax=Uliginosibacterium sp. 31-16 TaxID=3068315 RepID=UPI00273E9B14|nr:sulfonate ABC transporter substrate-binding protein [Uliginosibacterium sp. 31-16]MDP5240815.1 sulfonate ABC transporter substrate-binding protein [Uliginosibacterium sp. 31-16]